MCLPIPSPTALLATMLPQVQVGKWNLIIIIQIQIQKNLYELHPTYEKVFNEFSNDK